MHINGKQLEYFTELRFIILGPNCKCLSPQGCFMQSGHKWVIGLKVAHCINFVHWYRPQRAQTSALHGTLFWLAFAIGNLNYLFVSLWRPRLPGFSNCSLNALKRMRDGCMYNKPKVSPYKKIFCHEKLKWNLKTQLRGNISSGTVAQVQELFRRWQLKRNYWQQQKRFLHFAAIATTCLAKFFKLKCRLHAEDAPFTWTFVAGRLERKCRGVSWSLWQVRTDKYGLQSSAQNIVFQNKRTNFLSTWCIFA